MVCLGNICRSPLAEGILKQKVEQEGLSWKVDSAGTGAYHIGDLPDPRSIATARRYGIDITDQRARQISAQDLESFDLVLAMDKSNLSRVKGLTETPALQNKVRLIMDYAPEHALREVPDPYWDDSGFEQVFHMLTQAITKLVEQEQ